MPPHRHHRAEIMYVLKGKCVIHLYENDGATERAVPLRIGSYIWIEADVKHALQVDESCYMINAEYGVKKKQHALLSLESLCEQSAGFKRWSESGCAYLCGSDGNGKLHSVLNEIVDSFGMIHEEDAMRDLRMGQMLLILAQQLQEKRLNAQEMRYVRKAVEWLNEHMDEDVRIPAMAQELGLSAAYLHRVFKQSMGLTIVSYLNRLRIERSKLLLISTDDAVVEIAAAVGFNSRQHFTRIFTELVGLSPLQFRRKMKAEDRREVFYFDS